MNAIMVVKEEMEFLRKMKVELEATLKTITARIQLLEAKTEPDVDEDYDKDTGITEEVATADIETQDRERANAYKAELNTITTYELKAKAAEAAHAGHNDAIKARLSELGVRKISELPEHEFTDFHAFLERLIKESRDA